MHHIILKPLNKKQMKKTTTDTTVSVSLCSNCVVLLIRFISPCITPDTSGLRPFQSDQQPFRSPIRFSKHRFCLQKWKGNSCNWTWKNRPGFWEGVRWMWHHVVRLGSLYIYNTMLVGKYEYLYIYIHHLWSYMCHSICIYLHGPTPCEVVQEVHHLPVICRVTMIYQKNTWQSQFFFDRGVASLRASQAEYTTWKFEGTCLP